MTSSDFLRRAKSSWLLTVGVGLLALVFVFRRGLDSNWDLLNYHYVTAYSLIHGSYLHDIAAAGLQSFLNPLPNLLAFFALSELAFPASAWAITLVQLAALPLLVLISRQVGRDLGFRDDGWSAFLALVLCLLAPLWWSELGTSFSDSSATPIVLLGLYLGLRGITQGQAARTALVFSGVLFGFAAGLKLTNAPFAVAFFLALLGASARYRWQDVLRLVSTLAVSMAVGFLLTAWWNIHLLNRWESPFFPLYNAWLKSPFADLVNFRDNRWRFNSFSEFGSFLWAAVKGTGKTSEVPFADARLLIFCGLSVAALAFRKSFGRQGRVAGAFLVFFVVSFILWSAMFAYQRYLIPIEVLFGLSIWVLLSRLTGNHKLVALLLAGCVMASAVSIKIPDWGHVRPDRAQSNHFGIQFSSDVASTPARYLVVGHPIAYILPFLHPDSRFYGLGFTSQIDELIRNTVARDDTLPLRVLASEEDSATLWDVLLPFKRDPRNTLLSCSHLRTYTHRYVICELQDRSEKQSPELSPVVIDFQDGSLPPSLLGVSGLSGQEHWGRWSSGDVVAVHFANCLPEGKLAIDLRGHAFGPNVGKPVYLALGSSKASVVLAEGDLDLSVTLENKARCLNTLEIHVPQKVSPRELGISGDSRTLGVGLVRLGIRSAR